MNTINCQTFKGMLQSASNNLKNKQEEINSYNVFPVPDGDTGTNMNMTFGAGVSDVLNSLNDHIGDSAKILSKGMLMGARGNSGVILSQIFKGFYKSVADKEALKVADFDEAYTNGSKTAYKAVMRPVEGTILTVVRESAEKGHAFFKKHPDASFEEYLDFIVKAANESLQHTPELLPILKEANVVDSGGAGLVAILEGAQYYLHGQPVKLLSVQESVASDVFKGYCVETVVNLNEEYSAVFDEEKAVSGLNKLGSEVHLSRKGNQVLVHVHTLSVGEVLTFLQRYGIFASVKVENMSIDFHHELAFEEETASQPYAVISVCNGEGIVEAFKEVGVQYFVQGGQTMNPPTEDFVSLIKDINADNIIIFPNNSNIFMAANQAKEVLKDRSITVISSRSVVEGLAGVMALNREASLEENIENINTAISGVTTGSVTYAVKNSKYQDITIRKGDYMGISNGEILVSDYDLMYVVRTLLEKIISEDSDYVTLIYGKDTDLIKVKQLEDYITEHYFVDCHVIDGKQELYPFIIGVE